MTGDGVNFNQFLAAFPDLGESYKPDSPRLLREVEREFEVEVPGTLARFWDEVGAGYFGERELYFFADATQPRDSLLAWNRKEFWRDICPPTSDGGPLFVAETCFGDQLGYRHEGGRCLVTFFSVDTFEGFIVAESLEELFTEVLADRYALTDPARLEAVARALGPLPPGKHYAPLVSPLAGGSDDPSNFHIVTPDVHFTTAVATYRALN
jgi:hypothetical protein